MKRRVNFYIFGLSLLLSALASQSIMAAQIVVIDTGVDAAALGGRLDPGGFDFVSNDADPSDESLIKHGTTIAQLALKSDPNASVLALRAYDVNVGSIPSAVNAAMGFAAGLGSAQIVNHSNSSLQSSNLAILSSVVNSGKIIVMQAGNQGGGSPTGDAQLIPALAGRALVVGGLDQANNLAVFSNKAGNLQNYYLTAPAFTSLAGFEGTSLAVPRVSSAASAIYSASPFLLPEEVVDILLKSAIDRGAVGIDPVFGNGELDLAAALTAIGAPTVPTEPGGGSGGGGGAAIGIALGAGLAIALLSKGDDELQKTIMVDDYGRAFEFDFASHIKVRNNRPGAQALFDSQRFKTDILSMQLNEQTQWIATVQNRDDEPFNLKTDDLEDDREFAFQYRWQGKENNYVMSLNSDLSNEFGALAESYFLNGATRFYASEVFSTPALGYSHEGTAIKLGWDKGLFDYRLGFSLVDDHEELGLSSQSVLFETGLDRENWHAGFQLGNIIEDGSLLGGSSAGALSVDSTSTWYLGLNGTFNLGESTRIFGAYFQGFSEIEDSADSVLDQFSGLRTEGYGIGLIHNHLFSHRDSTGIAFSNPLQTTHGSARLNVPVSQEITGRINFSSSRLSFENADRQRVLESFYNYQLSKRTGLFGHISYTRNPVSDLSMTRDRTLIFGLNHKF